AHVLRHSLAQLENSRRGCVTVFPLAHGLDRGILDIHRRMEIRLADAEGNNVAALTDELVHFRKDHERVLCAELSRPAAYICHGMTPLEKASSPRQSLFFGRPHS